MGKFVNQSPEENRERVSIVDMAAIQEGKNHKQKQLSD